jgi:hypothetical protein
MKYFFQIYSTLGGLQGVIYGQLPFSALFITIICNGQLFLNDHLWMHYCRLSGAWQILPIQGVLFQIKNEWALLNIAYFNICRIYDPKATEYRYIAKETS